MSVSHSMYHKWYSKKESGKMITVSITKAIAVVIASLALGMAVTNLIYVICERIDLLKECDKKGSQSNGNADNGHG